MRQHPDALPPHARLGNGLVLWLLTVVVTFATGNPNLVPTLVLLGSFLVPVSFVVWAFGRRHSGEVTAELLFSTFVTGGVLGVCLIWFDDDVELAALVWILCYGLALQATVSFAPPL